MAAMSVAEAIVLFVAGTLIGAVVLELVWRLSTGAW